jgi:hypothetical protein
MQHLDFRQYHPRTDLGSAGDFQIKLAYLDLRDAQW